MKIFHAIHISLRGFRKSERIARIISSQCTETCAVVSPCEYKAKNKKLKEKCKNSKWSRVFRNFRKINAIGTSVLDPPASSCTHYQPHLLLSRNSSDQRKDDSSLIPMPDVSVDAARMKSCDTEPLSVESLLKTICQVEGGYLTGSDESVHLCNLSMNILNSMPSELVELISPKIAIKMIIEDILKYVSSDASHISMLELKQVLPDSCCRGSLHCTAAFHSLVGNNENLVALASMWERKRKYEPQLVKISSCLSLCRYHTFKALRCIDKSATKFDPILSVPIVSAVKSCRPFHKSRLVFQASKKIGGEDSSANSKNIITSESGTIKSGDVILLPDGSPRAQVLSHDEAIGKNEPKSASLRNKKAEMSQILSDHSHNQQIPQLPTYARSEHNGFEKNEPTNQKTEIAQNLSEHIASLSSIKSDTLPNASETVTFYSQPSNTESISQASDLSGQQNNHGASAQSLNSFETPSTSQPSNTVAAPENSKQPLTFRSTMAPEFIKPRMPSVEFTFEEEDDTPHIAMFYSFCTPVSEESLRENVVPIRVADENGQQFERDNSNANNLNGIQGLLKNFFNKINTLKWN